MRIALIFLFNSKRKIANIFSANQNPLYFLIPFLALFSFSLILILGFYFKASSLLTQIAEISNDKNAITVLENFLNQISHLSIIAIFLSGILTIFLWLYYSHKTFGPLVPIQRFIQELKSGEYQKRVVLRKNDQLQHLATELNALAENLEEKQK